MKSELEKVTKAWPPISRAVRVPHTEADYRDLVELLDRITDEVGEDENHPLASLMDVLGVLIEKYEDEHVARSPSSFLIFLYRRNHRRQHAANSFAHAFTSNLKHLTSNIPFLLLNSYFILLTFVASFFLSA